MGCKNDYDNEKTKVNIGASKFTAKNKKYNHALLTCSVHSVPLPIDGILIVKILLVLVSHNASIYRVIIRCFSMYRDQTINCLLITSPFTRL